MNDPLRMILNNVQSCKASMTHMRLMQNHVPELNKYRF